MFTYIIEIEIKFINIISSSSAPIKRRKHIPQPAPFMNKQLRQAIYKKRMLHNTFIKCKNDYNWERYRKQLIKLKNNP
jgi:hypothetical protein